MMLMLRDDRVVVIFDSAQSPPNWIEATDIENEEYRFCDDKGQRYVGILTKPGGLFLTARFELRSAGEPDLKNALELVDEAVAIEPNQRFETLESLRQHLSVKRGP
jgi:hypothetical protein